MSTHHVEMCFFLAPGLGELPSSHLASPLTVASMPSAYNAEPHRRRSPIIPTGATPPRTATYQLNKLRTPSQRASPAALTQQLTWLTHLRLFKDHPLQPFFPNKEVATIPFLILPTYAGTALARLTSITPIRPRPHCISSLSPHCHHRRRST